MCIRDSVGFTLLDKRWVTGTDLSVFMQQSANNFPLFPARAATPLWDAFGPQLAATRDGRIYLMLVAGERKVPPPNEMYAYTTEFAFDAGSPVGMGAQGWFKPPALQVSTTKAVDLRSGTVPPSNTALTTDSQISVYGTFIEASGAMNDLENRAVFLKRP